MQDVLRYLAWLVASALSCLTATSTEQPSLSGRGEPSPRNSGSPSASHRCTWTRGTCHSRPRKTATTRRRFLPHLPKLALAELLPEDEALARELSGRDVLPGEGVHGEGGDGVHVAAGDALQPHDVRLGVVRRAAVEALVRRTLGDVGLGVAAAAC